MMHRHSSADHAEGAAAEMAGGEKHFLRLLLSSGSWSPFPLIKV